MINNLLNIIVLADFNIEKTIMFWRSSGLDNLIYAVTFLGYWATILFFTLVAAWYLKKQHQNFLALALVLVVCASGAMTLIIKALVDRARPAGDIPLYAEKLSSFPSAHAALAIALYGFLVYCIWRLNLSLIYKILLGLLLVLVIITVGFSRVYLGVHFLSDVIGGYLVGLLFVLVAMYLTRRR